MTALVSLLATLITFVFAGAVLRQYVRRPRPYRLAWSVALLCYGAATAVQFFAEVRGWDTAAFRAWYLFGGLLTAAYLGQGTAFLLLPRRLATALLVLLIVATAWGAARMIAVPLSMAEIRPPAGKISPNATRLPGDLRALAALLNIYGTLLLIGGAAWSAITYVDRMLDRRRRAGYRLASNLLIAGGSLVVASAGSLETLGHGEYLYAGEIAGITIIFLGFLRSSESVRFARPLQRGDPAAPALQPEPARASRASNERTVRSLKRLRDRERLDRR